MSDGINMSLEDPLCSNNLISMESRNFVPYEHRQPLRCVPNNGSKNSNEFCREFNNLECFVIKNNEENIPNIFVPTDLYVGSFKLQGNIENVIELINVDPNQSEDNAATNQETEVKDIKRNLNCAVLNLNGSYQQCSNGCFFSFLPDLPSNNCHSCATNVSSLEVLEKSAIESNIDEESTTGANNEQPENTNGGQGAKVTRTEEQDDVVFVREYNIKSAEESKKKETKQVLKGRGRKCAVEKRKNPVRKAHIDKVSQDLIEKLSYHPSVFNAKIKRKKIQPQPVAEQKNLRQSCRTTGAIYYPAEALSEQDYKVWPQTAHEIPFYNESKKVLELVPHGEHKKAVKAAPENKNLSKKVETNSSEENKDSFANVMSRSLNNVLNFTETLKQFNKVTKPNDLVLSRSEELESNQVENIADDRKNVCQENLKNDMFYDLIENTCILYSIAANQNNEQIAEVIISRSNNRK